MPVDANILLYAMDESSPFHHDSRTWMETALNGTTRIGERELRANLISDAVLVALCIEHGLEIISADSDFARFSEVRWRNPVA